MGPMRKWSSSIGRGKRWAIFCRQRNGSGSEAENDRLLMAWGWSQLSDEEIARLENDTKLYTTEEVIKHLESL
jgi:hypothetical protein